MDSHVRDFRWRVEEACQNACPCAREILLDGWLLRLAGGRTRRTNSVNPLRFGPGDPTSIVAEADSIYAAQGQALRFRVPSLVPEMDVVLARLGFAAEGETYTLFADLADCAAAETGDIALSTTPDAGWYEAWASMDGNLSPSIVASYRRSVDTLLLPRTFASRHVDGKPVAVAYGAIHRGLLVFESVITHPRHRGHGHAGCVLRALLAWGRAKGANGACLQVAADNRPAQALYRSAGLIKELYRYHYRSRAPV